MPKERECTSPDSRQRRTCVHQQANMIVEFLNLCAEGFRSIAEQLALDEKSLKLGVHLLLELTSFFRVTLFGCMMRVMSVSVKSLSELRTHRRSHQRREVQSPVCCEPRVIDRSTRSLHVQMLRGWYKR
jgi:hypothetical protein